MKCRKCGNEIENGSLFCVVCGAKQKVVHEKVNNDVDNSSVMNNVSYESKKTSNGNKGLLIMIVILLIILIGIGVYLIINQSNRNNSSDNEPTPSPNITPIPTLDPTIEPTIGPTPIVTTPAPTTPVVNINKVVCTGKYEEAGISMSAEVIGELDADNKIKSATVVYDIDDPTNATAYCSLFKLMEDPTKGITVTCSGTKITITNFDKVDADEDDDETIIGISKEDFIESMEDEDFICR